MKRLAGEAGKKTKRILRIDDTKNQIHDGEDNSFSKIDESSAFNPDITLSAESSTVRQIKDQIPSSLGELAHILRHPRQHVKEKTSETMTASQEPYLSRDDDERLVHVTGKLKHAEATLETGDGSENQVDILKNEIEEIEINRKEKRVAWTSSRYVHQAKVITQNGSQFPLLSSSRWIDINNNPQGCEWSQWFDHMRFRTNDVNGEPVLNDSEQPTEDSRDLVLQEFERIAMASNPLQQWLSSLQHLRTWDEPTKTASWFTILLVVWFCNRIFTFLNCYMIYQIIQQGSGAKTRKSLQESHDRAGDQDAKANTLGEMISRHGSSNWLDSVLESLEPFHPQLRNLADWMEVLVNFYEWKSARATFSLIFFFGSIAASSIFVGTDFTVRVMTLMAILAIFTHTPISARYPNYLRLLMPFHWIFWDIPTHIETSFRYLRLQAEDIRRDSVEQKSITTIQPIVDPELQMKSDSEGLTESTTGTEKKDTASEVKSAANSDIFAAGCSWKSITGTAIISFDEIRFMRKFPVTEMWRQSFQDMEEMEKGGGQTSVKKATENFLEMKFKHSTVRRLEELQKKDELFNVIIAFSGLGWQHL